MDAALGGADVRARLDAALAAAGVPPAGVREVTALGGGTFNTVRLVRRADGPDLVVKLAPGPGRPVLRYERGLLAAEAEFYGRAGAATAVPLPAVLTPPDARGDALVMTRCPGTGWPDAAGHLDEARRGRLRRELGGHVAALHSVTGPAFGYPSGSVGPARAGWRAAFTDMTEAVLADAERFGVPLPRPAGRIRELFAAHGALLDTVTVPRLVHFDLWDGNILVAGADGARPRIGGIVDAERAFWGDPLAELVSLALFGDIERDADFLAGYRAAGAAVTFDAAARRRLELYRGYLHLIMWVEAVPRAYRPRQVDWLRKHVRDPLGDLLDRWADGVPGGAALRPGGARRRGG